ncbi:MAG: abortive infection family protein [Streptosporangiaceae bacterium]
MEYTAEWDKTQKKRRLDVQLVEALRCDSLPDTSDVIAAEDLLDLVWAELDAYGSYGHGCDDKEIAVAIKAVEAVTRRLGVPVELPFRDFSTFQVYLLRHEQYARPTSPDGQLRSQGGLRRQVCRDMVEALLNPTRTELATLERRLAGPKIKEETISGLRNPAAIREHLARLQGTAHSDPPLAIGTAKELVETTAKTVLQERGLAVNDKDDLPALVRQAQEAVGLHPSSARSGPDSTDAMRRILGGLTSIAAGLGELRNRGYGTGHGPRGERVGLRPRHAQLAVNAAMTWCSIMLDTLSDPEASWRTEREPKRS